jgi:hypothetical protein
MWCGTICAPGPACEICGSPLDPGEATADGPRLRLVPPPAQADPPEGTPPDAEAPASRQTGT